MSSREKVENAVNNACEQLKNLDVHLFRVNAHERSFSHKFACYLQEEVNEWGEGWNVDCEYNRDTNPIKDEKLKKMLESSGGRVFPDVIVHHRGSQENLLIIEMKKSDANSASVHADRNKLLAYMSDKQLHYKFSAFIYIQLEDVTVEIKWIDVNSTAQ